MKITDETKVSSNEEKKSTRGSWSEEIGLQQVIDHQG